MLKGLQQDICDSLKKFLHSFELTFIAMWQGIMDEFIAVIRNMYNNAVILNGENAT